MRASKGKWTKLKNGEYATLLWYGSSPVDEVVKVRADIDTVAKFSSSSGFTDFIGLQEVIGIRAAAQGGDPNSTIPYFNTSLAYGSLGLEPEPQYDKGAVVTCVNDPACKTAVLDKLKTLGQDGVSYPGFAYPVRAGGLAGLHEVLPIMNGIALNSFEQSNFQQDWLRGVASAKYGIADPVFSFSKIGGVASSVSAAGLDGKNTPPTWQFSLTDFNSLACKGELTEIPLLFSPMYPSFHSWDVRIEDFKVAVGEVKSQEFVYEGESLRSATGLKASAVTGADLNKSSLLQQSQDQTSAEDFLPPVQTALVDTGHSNGTMPGSIFDEVVAQIKAKKGAKCDDSIQDGLLNLQPPEDHECHIVLYWKMGGKWFDTSRAVGRGTSDFKVSFWISERTLYFAGTL